MPGFGWVRGLETIRDPYLAIPAQVPPERKRRFPVHPGKVPTVPILRGRFFQVDGANAEGSVAYQEPQVSLLISSCMMKGYRATGQPKQRLPALTVLA